MQKKNVGHFSNDSKRHLIIIQVRASGEKCERAATATNKK